LLDGGRGRLEGGQELGIERPFEADLVGEPAERLLLLDERGEVGALAAAAGGEQRQEEEGREPAGVGQLRSSPP